MSLLALNCGSSSFKFTLFNLQTLEVLAKGQASAIGTPKASLEINNRKHKVSKTETHHEIFHDVLEGLRSLRGKDEFRIPIITHRIVHGANEEKPMVITKDHQDGLQTMEKLSSFAPLHNHHAVLVVRSALELVPEAKNILCFDTLFHRTLPPEVYTYPIDHSGLDTAIPLKKYGFHGLSYASILTSVAKFLNKSESECNLIICHLGSGASMCCIKNGQSIDTTMGLTPLEGLPGGTRSGSIDPSLVFHLFGGQGNAAEKIEAKGITTARGEMTLNKTAGFQGLTGTTDFKEISDRADSRSEKDGLAIKIFENRILHYLGAYLLLLKNTPDAIVFSGGIGEKAGNLRANIASAIAHLGVRLDDERNASQTKDVVHDISDTNSQLKLLRVLTDEELQCAKMAKGLLNL